MRLPVAAAWQKPRDWRRRAGETGDGREGGADADMCARGGRHQLRNNINARKASWQVAAYAELSARHGTIIMARGDESKSGISIMK